LVALDRHHALRTLEEQRAREAAGSRTDLDHGPARERARDSGDAPRQVEVEDEILAQALARAELEAAQDLAQRRQAVGARCRPIAAHGGPSAPDASARRPPSSAASRSAAMKLPGRA